WRLDIYIDFLGLAATANKLATEEEDRGGNDDHKDHQYCHDCGAAAATIIISHKIHPPLCIQDSLLVGDVTGLEQKLEGWIKPPSLKLRRARERRRLGKKAEGKIMNWERRKIRGNK